MNNNGNEQTSEFEVLTNKCLKQVKNKLYFKYKSLSPAIYRMPVSYVTPGSGMFGTDSHNVYADPMDVIIRYKKSPDALARTYLHMLFHCIYLHPFVTKYGVDIAVWNIALDVCAEAAVMRLDPAIAIDGDSQRTNIINSIKNNVKMFLPELVYKELMTNKYDLELLTSLFHMDDHIWLENNGKGGGNNNNDNDNEDDDNDYQNPNKQPQQQPQDQDKDQDQNQDQDQDQDQKGQGDENQNQNDSNNNGNGKNKKNNKQNQQNQTPSQSRAQQQKKQEWSDVSRQIAADMQSFHKQGSGSGDTVQEIDYLTQDKMEYDEFLRQFSVVEEKMMVNMDEFDYMYYTYGLSMPGDKKKLLIEPLEYKEEKVIKDFVIAIDTSGSCSGDLVKKFINKTYSILKETESFSSRVNIHIVQCDARVQHDTKITNLEEMEYFIRNLKLYGFGGTDFRPVFEYVDDLIAKKEFENLCGLIYFTDGYGTYPTKPTQYKTAFAFLEDYNGRDVPPWAMSVYWKED